MTTQLTVVLSQALLCASFTLLLCEAPLFLDCTFCGLPSGRSTLDFAFSAQTLILTPTTTTTLILTIAPCQGCKAMIDTAQHARVRRSMACIGVSVPPVDC